MFKFFKKFSITIVSLLTLFSITYLSTSNDIVYAETNTTYTDRTAKNFAYDLKDSSSAWGLIGIGSMKALPIAAGAGGISWYLGNIGDNLLRVVNEDPGQCCILFITWIGYYTITPR